MDDITILQQKDLIYQIHTICNHYVPLGYINQKPKHSSQTKCFELLTVIVFLFEKS